MVGKNFLEEHRVSTQFSRRSFLHAAAAATGVAALHPSALALDPGSGANGATAIKLGVASYTFRNFDRAKVIGFMEQLNNRHLNAKDVKDHLPMEPAAETAALAAYKAANVAVHAVGTVYFQKDENADIRAKFDYAKRAGVEVIVAGDPKPEVLPRLERFVKEYDIRIAIHNHGPEDKVWPSPMDVLKAVRTMDPRLGCCIDVGHTVRAGTNVIDAIHAAGKRLFNIHMKDLTDFSAKDSQVAVGQGKMPVREIFRALIEVRYPGFVDLEYEVHPEDPMPGVAESFSYMRRVLGGMDLQA